MKLFTRKITRIILLLILFVSVASADMVIVVHRDNPVEDISINDLKRIYLGKITTFKNGETIELLDNASLKKRFYYDTIEMSLLKVKKHWMKLIFSGEFVTPPVEFTKIEELKNHFCENKNVICYMNSSVVDSCMKVIKVDGKLMGEVGYPLKLEKK